MGRRKPAAQQRTDGLNVRVIPELGKVFRARAKSLRWSLADYLEALIQADAGGQVIGQGVESNFTYDGEGDAPVPPMMTGEPVAPYSARAAKAGVQVTIAEPYGAAVAGIAGVRGVSADDFVSELVKAKVEAMLGVS